MLDEFDEGVDQLAWRQLATQAAHKGGSPSASAPRLVARAYRSANAALRTRLLACLLRPLGTLSLVAVSGGAFASFLSRSCASDAAITLDEVARFSGQQILELARFVEQVNPQALQQVGDLLSENTAGLAAFSASVALLLYRRLRPTAKLNR